MEQKKFDMKLAYIILMEVDYPQVKNFELEVVNYGRDKGCFPENEEGLFCEG